MVKLFFYVVTWKILKASKNSRDREQSDEYIICRLSNNYPLVVMNMMFCSEEDSSLWSYPKPQKEYYNKVTIEKLPSLNCLKEDIFVVELRTTLLSETYVFSSISYSYFFIEFFILIINF